MFRGPEVGSVPGLFYWKILPHPIGATVLLSVEFLNL